MKMMVFERPFQRDLVEPCKPINNFSRGPKSLKTQKMATPTNVEDLFYCIECYIAQVYDITQVYDIVQVCDTWVIQHKSVRY